MLFFDPLYAVSGFLVGFVVGLTGVGGGSLMTPLLVLFFGIHPATAVGTDLFFAAATKSAGTLAHGFNKAVEWRIVLTLGIGSVTASAVTIALLTWLGFDSAPVSALVSGVLGGMLLLTAVSLFFRDRLLALAHSRFDLSPRARIALTIVTGAILGCLVSISSVGAGALGLTALMLLYPRLPLARLVGTDIAHAVPLTLVAGIGHSFAGTIDWPMLFSLLVGSIPGILIASFIAPRIRELPLRMALATVLTVTGVRLLTSVL